VQRMPAPSPLRTSAELRPKAVMCHKVTSDSWISIRFIANVS